MSDVVDPGPLNNSDSSRGEQLGTFIRLARPSVDVGADRLRSMRAHDGRINDQIFKILIIRHRIEYVPPYAFLAPSAEAPENAI